MSGYAQTAKEIKPIRTVGSMLRDALDARDKQAAEDAVCRVKEILESIRIDLDADNLENLPRYLDDLFNAVGIKP